MLTPYPYSTNGIYIPIGDIVHIIIREGTIPLLSSRPSDDMQGDRPLSSLETITAIEYIRETLIRAMPNTAVLLRQLEDSLCQTPT